MILVKSRRPQNMSYLYIATRNTKHAKQQQLQQPGKNTVRIRKAKRPFRYHFVETFLTEYCTTRAVTRNQPTKNFNPFRNAFPNAVRASASEGAEDGCSRNDRNRRVACNLQVPWGAHAGLINFAARSFEPGERNVFFWQVSLVTRSIIRTVIVMVFRPEKSVSVLRMPNGIIMFELF